MLSKFIGLSTEDADNLMQGLIGCTICEALDEARRMTPDELSDRDIFEWSHYVAGLVMVIVHSRRWNAP